MEGTFLNWHVSQIIEDIHAQISNPCNSMMNFITESRQNCATSIYSNGLLNEINILPKL